MDGLRRCTTVLHVKKTCQNCEFWQVTAKGKESTKKTRWGWQRRGGTRERGNDRLIYSKNEWVNQTLMAFGSASHSLSSFHFAPLTHRFHVCSHRTYLFFLSLCLSHHPPPSRKHASRWSLANISLLFFDRQICAHLTAASKSRCSSCSAG